MLTLGKKSKYPASKIITKAVSYFGPAGMGLTVKDRSACCATFASQGAFVTVEASDDADHGGSNVHIESREFEFSAKEFLQQI